jgi:isopentenyldiphosphate isomerase
MDDELLDLVNGDDTVIGTVNRKDYQQLLQHDLGYIRASELFIINDRGQIWVPIRAADKTIAPNGYDYSAAGHVGSGDDYVSAIIRETEEEINLHIKPKDLEFVTKIKSDNEKYFRSIFVIRSNIAPMFNTVDFVSAEWLTPDKLLKNIRNGHTTKSTIEETVVALQKYLRIK